MHIQSNTVPVSVATSAMQSAFSHSVVIPFYNECDNAVPLLNELVEVEHQLGLAWEYILVSDCGTDGTPAILQHWSSEHKNCRFLTTPVNQGQAASLFAGLHAATSPLLITMDGDGQNVPADIPKLLAKIGDVDMVVGIRSNRNDSWLRRVMSKFANRVRGNILGLSLIHI